MLAIDLVRFCGEMLKRLSECDILLDDYKRVGMCDEYYDVEPGTEDAAWLQGFLVRSIVKVMHNA